MKTTWYFLGWAVLLVAPGLAQAQHGGHSAGHVGGAPPAHFYGGAGGMHVPPPTHIAPPPMHTPASPAVHLPPAPHLPAPSINPHVPVSAAPHAPATHSPATHTTGNGQGGNGQAGNGQAGNGQAGNGQGGNGQGGNGQAGNGQGGTAGPNTSKKLDASQLAALEAAQFAALEARYLSAPWAFGFPSHYRHYGLGGIPYYYGANYLYGYGAYQRPYYYGYLSGVPYINYYNYSPVYYSFYNDLPSITGSVTTQTAAGNAVAQSAGASSSQDWSVEEANGVEITAEQARAMLDQAQQDLAAGKYQQAVQNAGKAAMQLHEESQLHEVLWLSLMGLADYRGAAIEAHAVDHFGVTPSWNDVAMKHSDPTRFNEQMKKLETFVERNKDSDFGAFLLGYNYLVLGHKDAARQWLELAAKMDPQDVLCAKLVASLQDNTTSAKPTVGLLPGDTTPAG